MGPASPRGEHLRVFRRTISPPLGATALLTPTVGAAARTRYAVPIIVAASYYIGARIGLFLTPAEHPVSTLWPPNAILLGALLLAPYTSWLTILAAAFPAHLLVEVHSGVPVPMVLCWFISNCAEAVIGALGFRMLAPGPVRLDTFRRVGVFVGVAALFAPFASSFLDAAFVALNDWGTQTYWEVWRVRFFSNVLAVLTLVPVIIAIGNRGWHWPRLSPRPRFVEGGLLTVALLLVCGVVFTGAPLDIDASPALLYAPLPILLWAAVRFGPAGASGCLLVFAVLSVWGAINGHGPFIGYSVNVNVLSLQLFLIVTYVPLLSLTAVLRERRRAEQQARRNEAQLTLALSAAHVATWDWTIDAARTQYLRFLETVHHDDRPAVEAAVQKAIDGLDTYEVEFRRAGAYPEEWKLTKGRVVRDADGVARRMVGVTADVTERKLAEAALRRETLLRESAAQLRELANAMPQIVFTATAGGHIDFFNKKWYALTGSPEEPITEETWLSVIHPHDRGSCLETWLTSVSGGRPHEHEARFRSGATDTYRWHLVRALPVRDASGTIRRWYGTATDIDDRKLAEDAMRESEAKLRFLGERLEQRVAERTIELSRANDTLRAEIDVRVRTERALRESEERFAKAFRASPDAIAITHASTRRIIEVNGRWQALFDCTRQEAIGRTADDLGFVQETDVASLREALTLTGYVREMEMTARNRKGEEMRCLVNAELMEVSGEPCHITMFRDVTERRRAEHLIAAQRRQLAHLGRVAVLGELSGALAHELNQPLTAILANARAAQRLMSRPSFDLTEISNILGDIAADDLRAGAVIRRMRDLIRNGETVRQFVDPNALIQEVLDLAHGDLMLREVDVSTRLAGSLPEVPLDRVQLQQVLLNLIVNACDAMADNPREERSLLIATAPDCAGIRISVRDHGVGIGASVEEVFEPFRSTKEHGLGLGLAICRSIVTAHGGKLWAVNNAGRGATFHLTLPLEAYNEN